jgi:hypothetical protein
MGEYWYEDETGTIIYVPVSEIAGEKKMGDGSTRFKLLGGPLHDMVYRVYPPYDTIRFPTGDVYDLHPPHNLKKSKKWMYVYNTLESRQ